MEMPFEIATRLADKWCTDRRLTAHSEVARELLDHGVTVLIQFVHVLQDHWKATGRGGFNHELDELALFLEPSCQFYVGRRPIK